MSVIVAGVGLVPFRTPGKSDPYDVMGERAIRAALADAGLGIHDIDQAYVGYVYADSAAGQTALYGVGASGIPVVNVNNYCASGSTALWLGRQAILAGTAQCVLVVGFEQMTRGAIGSLYTDRPESLWRFSDARARHRPASDAPLAAQFFGDAGQAYLDRYDADATLFAQVAVKARRHAAANPDAVFRDPLSMQDVLGSTHVYGPLTRLQCCPPTCGAAAAVLCTPEFARSHGLDGRICIRAQVMTSDTDATFSGDAMELVGAGIARRAAEAVYEDSGVDPRDIPVVELHDCFTTNEVISYEALGLTPEGTSARIRARRPEHVRRTRRDQPLGRTPLQRAPARRDRPGAVCGARLAAARNGRSAPSRGRAPCSAAQPGPGKRVRCDPVRAIHGLTADEID